MVQFMLKGRPPAQQRVSEDMDSYDHDSRAGEDLSVLYDSLKAVQ